MTDKNQDREEMGKSVGEGTALGSPISLASDVQPPGPIYHCCQIAHLLP